MRGSVGAACFDPLMQTPPKKSTAREVTEKTIEGGAGMIPLVGSAIAAAFTYAVGYAFNNRMQQWYDDVASAIQELQDREEGLDFDQLADDPVLVDAVVHETRAAQGTHQREKLDALRNGIINSIGPGAPSADEQLRFLRLIDQFSPAHLRMLTFWRDPAAFFETEGIPRPNIYSGARMALLDVVPDFAGKSDWNTLLASDLNGTGLMAGQLGGMMTEQGLYQSRRYEKGLTALPDWRITCFFTGKGLCRCGVADAALGGALAEIAGHGGGTVEGYPEETDDRTLSGSFLHTGPMAAFENHGFARTRLISPHRWVVTRTVDPV